MSTAGVGPVTRVGLEVGRKWVFASALEWPGWCRRGKGGEDAAIDALLGYADRYVLVAGPGFTPGEVSVVGKVTGNATTDFGAPDVTGPWDDAPLAPEEADRQTSLLEASWRYFDTVVAWAPAELRKGPRVAAGTATRSRTTSVRQSGVLVPRSVSGSRRRRPGWTNGHASRPHCELARRPGHGRRATRSAASPGTCSTTPGKSRTRVPEVLAPREPVRSPRPVSLATTAPAPPARTTRPGASALPYGSSFRPGS